MSNEIEIRVPDIGDVTEVEVIEVMIKVGDTIALDDPIITLESDKASMEIPASHAGKITAIDVALGDKVSEGDVILHLQLDSDEMPADPPVTEDSGASDAVTDNDEPALAADDEASTTPSSTRTEQVVVPDIGDVDQVDVIEVMVKAGDKVEAESSLITLEGDKATMDIPAPTAGTVTEVTIAVGDKVSQGSPILMLEVVGEASTETAAPTQGIESTVVKTLAPAKESEAKAQASTLEPVSSNSQTGAVYASPAIRRIAREFGVDLGRVKGSGRKGRITKDDVRSYVKSRLSAPQNQGAALPTQPVVDFSKFGEVDIQPLNKIKRLTAKNVHRSWLTIPHVTQFDKADITEMEDFRQSNKAKAEKEGYKLTPLAFITKAVAKALSVYPQFNSSLDETGENLIYKKFINVGIAVDTPNGLVVPVIRDADTQGIADLAREMMALGKKARSKALMPKDMSGGCFTISSLGGIGGTAFTPIVNAPEVAILGVSRSQLEPVFMRGEFVPRLMLPLSLSYDHRVIDGAEAARFTSFLSQCLSDIRTLLL